MCPGFQAPAGPLARSRWSKPSAPPDVWLSAERDVLLAGQTPDVDIFAPVGGGSYRITSEFDLSTTLGSVDRACDPSRRPASSRGLATLNFECKRPSSVGLFTISVRSERLGVEAGATAHLALRVVDDVAEPEPAPDGWVAFSLMTGIRKECLEYGPRYDVRSDGARVTIERRERRTTLIPRGLGPRMSPDHAHAVRFVFEDQDGWLVMFDHGEFGGGVEWYARQGGAPRSIALRLDGDETPQNVNRATVVGGSIFILQGLSHLSSSSGQLSALWREHDHFTSRVIARYRSEPTDWAQLSTTSWLVLTDDAIWHTTTDGKTSLASRLPSVPGEPASLARASDGRLYVGGTSGVLRLTERWPEHPKYVAELLLPKDSAEQKCWASAPQKSALEPHSTVRCSPDSLPAGVDCSER